MISGREWLEWRADRRQSDETRIRRRDGHREYGQACGAARCDRTDCYPADHGHGPRCRGCPGATFQPPGRSTMPFPVGRSPPPAGREPRQGAMKAASALRAGTDSIADRSLSKACAGSWVIIPPRPAGAIVPGCEFRQRKACNAPVAQLDRVLPSEGSGRGFESLRARHFGATGLLCACRISIASHCGRCRWPSRSCDQADAARRRSSSFSRVAMRRSRFSSVACTSSASKRSGMCCGQLASQALIVNSITCSGRAL